MIFSASRNNGFFWGWERNILLCRFDWRRLQRGNKLKPVEAIASALLTNSDGRLIEIASFAFFCALNSLHILSCVWSVSHCTDIWYSKGLCEVQNHCQSGTCKPTVQQKQMQKKKKKSWIVLHENRCFAVKLYTGLLPFISVWWRWGVLWSQSRTYVCVTGKDGMAG